MNRETAYRGKRVDNGEWVYGAGVSREIFSGNNPNHIWLFNSPEYGGEAWVAVIPSTVGERTGRKDMHGDKLYEDDKFLAQDEDEPKEETWVIKFIDGCFIADRKNGNYPLKMDYWAESEIHKIGTIHDTEEQAK